MSDGLAQLLEAGRAVEELELRSTFGFMAFHGGRLEVTTDRIAREAAEISGSSYYGVLHTDPDPKHIPSTRFDPAESDRLSTFLDHVEIVVTVHGFGRRGMFSSLLLGGRNRDLAHHVGRHIDPLLPGYRIITDLAEIPVRLRGLHDRNPVNRPRLAGVQIELPPRVRGQGPLWWDHEGDTVPHTEALITGLAAAASDWPTGAVPVG
ncbi:MAG: poly-gamma-glutamate hydrolase family protein [Ilumatobacteraceae bacterium]|jgi:phage replication-related protein YjqB (UPF0714/DUF867 family)